MPVLQALRVGTLVLVLGTWMAGALAATDINGVKVDDNAEVQGKKLFLNGAGTRYKGPFKVTVTALYLERRASSLEEILAQPGARRLHITLLRDVDADEIGRSFSRGVEDNLDRTERARLVPSLLRMGQIFFTQKHLSKGDTVVIDWVPGQGTLVSIKGMPTGDPFREPEFFKGLLAGLLGPVPADFKLKDALLNPEVRATTTP